MRVEIEGLSDDQFWNPREPPKRTLSGLFFCPAMWLSVRSELDVADFGCPSNRHWAQSAAVSQTLTWRGGTVFVALFCIVLSLSWRHHWREHKHGAVCFPECSFPYHASFRPSLHLRSPLRLERLESAVLMVINPGHVGCAIARRQNRASFVPSLRRSLALGECLSQMHSATFFTIVMSR